MGNVFLDLLFQMKKGKEGEMEKPVESKLFA